jgi:acyl-CoA reductase-like NAD-dependent aldehyde dehydrogenase
MNTVPSCRAGPSEATLHSLREAFNAGRTRPTEFRTAQLRSLGRFLQENKELLQDALAKDVGKVLYGG